MNRTEGFITGILLTAIVCIIIAIVVRSLENYEREINEQTSIQETAGEILSKCERQEVCEGFEDKMESRLPAIVIEIESESEETEAYDSEIAFETVTIKGKTLDPEIASYLKRRLEDYGIEQWWPYAIAQCFQESSFDPMARNKNGLDMGLFQYRVTYWDFSKGDIFDWRVQIDLYVQQTDRRLNQYGCSICETISRHNTSDYGSYNQEYVDQVMQWVEPE